MPRRKAGVVSGRFAAIGRAIEAQLAARNGRAIPMNIDGATGVVFAELGFPPPLCRGLFVLSRSVGALAHAFEEMQSGERNKGPIPRHLTWSYTGPPAARRAGRAVRRCAVSRFTSPMLPSAAQIVHERAANSLHPPLEGQGRRRASAKRRGGVSFPCHPTPARDVVARRPSSSRGG